MMIFKSTTNITSSRPVHFRKLYENKKVLKNFIFTLLCGVSTTTQAIIFLKVERK